MKNNYIALGLMSGTSGDGVDASIIESDGEKSYRVYIDKYFKYDSDIYENIHILKDKINNKPKNLIKYSDELKDLEKKITLFHVKAVKETLPETKLNVDFIGFHGQTILHNPTYGITKQLGNGSLLSQMTAKPVIYDFRQNDIKHGGEGAPLAPIFHELLVNQIGIGLPVSILNIGGISNVTNLRLEVFHNKLVAHANDIGPGNCLIDEWIKNNSDQQFDDEGKIAQAGNVNKIILNQVLETWRQNHNSDDWIRMGFYPSLDTKDFNTSFVRGLSLEDGAATLTEYTSQILADYFNKVSDFKNILICGGGRKNKLLINSIQKKIKQKIIPTEDFGVNGDFVESQAFAYLAIRSYLGLEISFPETTGCKKASTGGVWVKNF